MKSPNLLTIVTNFHGHPSRIFNSLKLVGGSNMFQPNMFELPQPRKKKQPVWKTPWGLKPQEHLKKYPKSDDFQNKKIMSSFGPQKITILLMEEILHQLIWRIYHYLQGVIHLMWCRIPSINSISHFLCCRRVGNELLPKGATRILCRAGGGGLGGDRLVFYP